MTTILKEINITGNSLMRNLMTTVCIKPSEEKGIKFFVSGDKEGFLADIDNVVTTKHCVTLANRDKKNFFGKYRYKAMLCEHFFAACAILGIDSLNVYMNEYEMPILDGSAKEWIRLFREAGIEKAKKSYYTVSEPVYYLNGKTSLIILPDDKLNISYSVNYDHPDLRNKWVSLDMKKLDEIIEARTFGYLKDLKRFQFFGFARGVTIENTVGLVEMGYTTELRSEYEPAKHKILDLIGDLYLAGVSPLDLRAQILVKEAGHTVHLKVAKELKNKLVKIK